MPHRFSLIQVHVSDTTCVFEKAVWRPRSVYIVFVMAFSKSLNGSEKCLPERFVVHVSQVLVLAQF